MFGQVFLAAVPTHWCHVDGCTYAARESTCDEFHLDRWACEEALVRYSVPPEEDVSRCQKYRNVSCEGWTPDSNVTRHSDQSLISCDDGWDYDFFQYKSSIISDWDLVCGSTYLDTLASSLFMVGVMIGAIAGGALADKIGRKNTLLMAILFQLVFGIVTAFSVNYIMFVICRFLVGVCVHAMFVISFVIGTEIVGPSKRTMAGIVIELYFASGYMILALLAYLIRDWRMLQLVITIPSVLLLSFFWLIPESPRWLLSQSRTQEAADIVKRIAESNGVDSLPANLFDASAYAENPAENNFEMSQVSNPVKARETLEYRPTTDTKICQDSEEEVNFLDLFKFPNMRKKTLALYYIWFTNAFVYYGLSLNTSNLGGDDYLNAFISGAVEIPAYLAAWYLVDVKFIGRKMYLVVTMILAGIFCIATPFPSKSENGIELEWLTITLSMIGKFCISTSFATIYIFSCEIFPTPLRSVGVGSSSMFASSGSVLSPFFLLIGELTFDAVPYFVFGGLAILAGLLSLILPETLGQLLPETLEEAEAFGIKKKVESRTENGSEGVSNDGFSPDEDNKFDFF